jgi:hypothetical protein
MTRQQDKIAVEARRQQVSVMLAKRMTYRDIADELEVSLATIAADAKNLRERWSKSIGAAEVIFTDSAMALDRWQARVEGDLDSLPAERRPGAVDTLVRISDQRAKLFGLYPKPGRDEPEIPTGPIELKIEMIPSGNRRLLDADAEDAIEEGETDGDDPTAGY